jgi:NO-binding membrane sensor protein with MHYT domain
MVHANEFSQGPLTPGLAFAMSCVGSFLGLRCAGRARACAGIARAEWLLLAASAIGATGIWVMHNIALLGFSIPGQVIRYDVPMSLLSGVVAVAVVFAALVIAGSGGAGFPRLLLGGVIIGGGVLFSMDFVGMAAMRMPDTIQYNGWGVLLSVLIAVAAATLALWAALRQRGIRPAMAASVAMGVAISGMHYTAMAAMRFTAAPGAAGMLGGVTAADFVLPLIVVISVLTFILILSVALGRTEEQIRAEAALDDLLARHRGEQPRETSAPGRGRHSAPPPGPRLL